MHIRNFSFGAAAAIVTSMGLIIGLDAAAATKAAILSGLLIVAIADNLTDSLSVHMYQEAERLDRSHYFWVKPCGCPGYRDCGEHFGFLVRYAGKNAILETASTQICPARAPTVTC
ncbi:MAG: hypothetical protein A3F74_14315 [Betaproteobacteria bacterium RIFCSPLOWO2_12_FULL_62_58]|nr:MAG: hypothetical protein A3F74_14315 [Betaproteobacteria bacterium RIFCSPLOWO2_12_FULL_62_58]